MRKKFIAYGSNHFIDSSKRIIEEANSLNIFNETKRYTYEDLPIPIKSSPLFLNEHKGGFWLWKPYIIYESLRQLNEGDILVYADSGCTLLDNLPEWNRHFDYLIKNDAVFFQYRKDKNYGWNAFNSKYSDNKELKYWIKKKTIEHFTNIWNSDNWLNECKLMAGLIFLKKNENSLKIIKEWLDTMVFYPELVIDPLLHEMNDQFPEFSVHRHDQSILSVLVRFYQKQMNLLILDESSDGDYPDQIVKASRKRDLPKKSKTPSILRKFFYKIKKN